MLTFNAAINYVFSPIITITDEMWIMMSNLKTEHQLLNKRRFTHTPPHKEKKLWVLTNAVKIMTVIFLNSDTTILKHEFS
jgi:hypothetical protein